MEPKVTPGMIAVGVTNIVLASLGLGMIVMSAAAVGTIVVARSVTNHPLRIPKHFSQDIGGLVLTEHNVSWILAGAGCVLVLFAAMDVLLFVAGLSVLGKSPRGRTYCMVWAAIALCMGVVDSGILVGQWNGHALWMLPFVCLSPAYALLLITLFRRPAWKHAFAA